MFTRELPELTLIELRQQIRDQHDGLRSDDVPIDSLRFDLTAEQPRITWRGGSVPGGLDSVVPFADYVGAPAPFFKGLSTGLQEGVLEYLVQHVKAESVRITHRPGEYVQQVVEADRIVVDPADLIARLINVMGPAAEVVEYTYSSTEFFLDAIVPEGHGRAIGGEHPDGEREVGDITRGGLRVEMNRRRNLAPTIQPFNLRLVCTNGMEVQDLGLKLDARVRSAESILAEFEALAQRVMTRLDSQIEALYDLKRQRVDNPERALAAIAREQDIPARSLLALVQLAAGDDLPDQPTMFDVVNLITNLANGLDKPGPRRKLERAAGAVVGDHAARCGHCQSKVAG